MATDRMKLTEVAPSHCSSCFQQKPRMRHVDMGAFYDGPVIKNEEGVIQHVIDDLILCEDCIRMAGRHLGLGDVQAVGAELKRAESENDDLMEQVRGLKLYIAKMEEAIQIRPNGQAKPAKRKAAV